MQTHFSEQQVASIDDASLDEASTRAVADLNLQQDSEPQPTAQMDQSWSCLISQVPALLRVEQLVTRMLLPTEQEVSKTASCTLGELALKYREVDGSSLPSEEDSTAELADLCKQVFHLLLRLPFIQVSGYQVESEVSLINPKSISMSTAKDGAAQCFLVIQESETAALEHHQRHSQAKEDQKSEVATKLSLKSISDFVNESKYGSHLRLMSSIDQGEAKPSADGAWYKIQGRFFAEAHTFALAVQALIASDLKLSKLTSSYLEQAMSVSAPVFDPLKAAQRLNYQQFNSQQQQQPVGPENIASSSQQQTYSDQELLRHNIAQMYQYYNQLIFRQGQQSRYQQHPATGENPRSNQRGDFQSVGHRTVTYISPSDQSRLINTSAQQQFHQGRSHSMRHDNYESADRSRSRSTARNASDNLLVSLDEAVLPPQITSKVRKEESSALSPARQPLSSEAAAQGPGSVSSEKLPNNRNTSTLSAGQHPEIQIRYTKREILQIFKGLGRFQSPLDQHHFYEIDMDKVGGLLRDKLLLSKPDVVLEHLKTEKAIPLTSNARIQRKLFSTVKRYYDSVSGEVPPSHIQY